MTPKISFLKLSQKSRLISYFFTKHYFCHSLYIHILVYGYSLLKIKNDYKISKFVIRKSVHENFRKLLFCT